MPRTPIYALAADGVLHHCADRIIDLSISTGLDRTITREEVQALTCNNIRNLSQLITQTIPLHSRQYFFSQLLQANTTKFLKDGQEINVSPELLTNDYSGLNTFGYITLDWQAFHQLDINDKDWITINISREKILGLAPAISTNWRHITNPDFMDVSSFIHKIREETMSSITTLIARAAAYKAGLIYPSLIDAISIAVEIAQDTTQPVYIFVSDVRMASFIMKLLSETKQTLFQTAINLFKNNKIFCIEDPSLSHANNLTILEPLFAHMQLDADSLLPITNPQRTNNIVVPAGLLSTKLLGVPQFTNELITDTYYHRYYIGCTYQVGVRINTDWSKQAVESAGIIQDKYSLIFNDV